MVTCISGIKIFYQFLAESENIKNNIHNFKLQRDYNKILKRNIEISKINKVLNNYDKKLFYQNIRLLQFSW